MKRIKPHIEWMVFLTGLILMATMDPTIQSTSICFFDFIGIGFCPGDGLGHSIAWFFRGEFQNSIEANLFGPVAVIVLSLRILQIWKEILINKTNTQKGHTDGRSI
tara:strand:- start:2658 stop:2975 length:318 start_codon:yes stop_codon:yes gene_type:complete